MAAYVYTMRDRKNRGDTAGTKYDADLTPFRASLGMPQFVTARDSRINSRFGMANCPFNTQTAELPAGGYVLGIGFTNWVVAQLDAGKTVRVAVAIKNDTQEIYGGAVPQASPFQSGHNTGQVLFRVRYDTDGNLNTVIGENSGTVESPVLAADTTVHGVTVDDIATNDENMTEWYIQMTPNDPALSADTNKHNLYVAVRTVDAAGASVYALTSFAHYTTGSSGSNPRMTVSDRRFSLGKNFDDSVTGGLIGDYLALHVDAGTDGSVVTNTTTIGNTLNALWSGVSLVDRDGRANRGRGRERTRY